MGVEGLDADTVAGEEELTLLRVVDSEREHAVQLAEDFLPPLLEAQEQHFGIGLRSERVAEAGELSLDLLEIVDLSVEYDRISPVDCFHRLMPPRGEGANGEAV